MVHWYPLCFRSDGTLAFPNQIDEQGRILTALRDQPDGPVTDLWILSYGWNMSVQDGITFYNEWVPLLQSEIQKANLQNYDPMFVGIFWPSEILPDTSGESAQPAQSTAASPALPPGLGDRTHFIQAHRPIFDPEQKQDDAVYEQDFGRIYDFIASPDIQDQQQVHTFVDTLKKYQQQDLHAEQLEPENVIDMGASALAGVLPSALIPLQDAGKTVSDGLLEFLRVFSFWTMKGRAGTVGANGLAPFLQKVQQTQAQRKSPLRIHLMGHSFGAKLLTSAVYATADIPGVSQPVVITLILFQGAFSQFSFSRNIPGRPGVAGFYTKIVEQGLVATPVTAIYSARDRANSLLYPVGMAPVLEQFIFRDGDPPDDLSGYRISNDLRGAIGANGAQGFDMSQMGFVALPWSEELDQSKLAAVRCINVNRSLVVNNMTDLLIGTHNDYTEPEIFQAALKVSLLKRGE